MEHPSIKLHLADHCIETAAKKELKYLTDLYFNLDDDQDILLKKIKLLQKFIEKSDFRKLRSSDERLSGTKQAFVHISLDKNNDIVLNFEKT